MAHHNKWAMPSAPGKGGKRRRKKLNNLGGNEENVGSNLNAPNSSNSPMPPSKSKGSKWSEWSEWSQSRPWQPPHSVLASQPLVVAEKAKVVKEDKVSLSDLQQLAEETNANKKRRGNNGFAQQHRGAPNDVNQHRPQHPQHPQHPQRQKNEKQRHQNRGKVGSHDHDHDEHPNDSNNFRRNHPRKNEEDEMPKNSPIHRSRVSASDILSDPVQWKYESDRRLNGIPEHSDSKEQQVMVPSVVPSVVPSEDWWYFVDPMKESVSAHAVSKHELKQMFRSQYINEHCLIWNEFYSDYITIQEVPSLLNFFYDDASDSRPKGAPKREHQQCGEWEQLWTADGKPYFRHFGNKQIVWTKPAEYTKKRGAHRKEDDEHIDKMKIMINDQSMRHLNTKKNTKTANTKKAKKNEQHQRRMSKKDQRELAEFKENQGDVRWIPHSKLHGFVIAQFVERDGKYSIYMN